MRIGIITDIHENLPLLTEVIKRAEELRCDELVCLGDIVGYDHRFYNYGSSRSAGECLKLIRSSCRWITAGNHDLFAAGRFPSYSDGFSYPGNWFSLNSAERKIISSGKVWCYEGDEPNDLSDDDTDFLRTLPEYSVAEIEGIQYLFSHYFAPDFTGSTTQYIERSFQLQRHWDFFSSNNIRFSFSGHSHSHLTGFAYPSTGNYVKAIHSFPGDKFFLGNEPAGVILPPLSGEKGRRGFSLFDTDNRFLNIITLH